jgi:hypothetical protein
MLQRSDLVHQLARVDRPVRIDDRRLGHEAVDPVLDHLVDRLEGALAAAK